MIKQGKFLSVVEASVMVGVIFLIACLCFYPGTLNNDSIWQLDQALKNEYFDAHPPIMSYLWHLLNETFVATKGKANMFLFIVLIYSLAITLIAFKEQRTTISRALFIAVNLLFPPALLILGFIIKDTLMAVTLLLSYGLLLHAETKRSWYYLLLSFIPLFIGFSSRHNAVFAVYPLCVWVGFLICYFFNIQKKIIKPLLAIIIGSALLIGLFTMRDLFSNRFLHATQSYTSQFVLTYDLVGVSVRSNENLLPPFFNHPSQPISLDFLKKIYRPYTFFYIFYSEKPGDPTLPIIWTAQQEKDLMKYWLLAAKKHPKEMFFHKIESYFSALGLMYTFSQLTVNDLASPIGIPWAKLVPSSTMNGWIYLLILSSFLFLPLKLNPSQRALFWSAYLYGLSWVLCTPNAEQRYYSWVIISCTLLVTAKLMSSWHKKYLTTSPFLLNEYQKGSTSAPS